METGPVDMLVRDDGSSTGWRRFSNPVAVLSATSVGDVAGVLDETRRAVDGGRWAAGFLAYEAAPAFDPALVTRDPPPGVPRACFGLFDAAPEAPGPAPGAAGAAADLAWTPDLDGDTYRAAIGRIKDYLAAGDTYQVNYTFRLRAPIDDPRALFARMTGAQHSRYAAWFESPSLALCSASPELFFDLRDGELVSRPMKGTAARGATPEEDRRRRETLAASEKDRAENVMIVDMVRNDMGRVADAGSVRVDPLFEVETYPTLHQMVSTVRCRTRAPVPDILAALFPCASITGAPKVRTMEIIRELEPSPRGIYTGAIGYLAPGGRARFNVAIRTAEIDRAEGRARYGVGGGIVWDSDADREYEECRVKAAVLGASPSRFDLLETLRYEGDDGYFLRARHLARLERSAACFGFAMDRRMVERRLDDLARERGPRPARVRLRVSCAGDVRVEHAELPPPARTAWRVARAAEPVPAGDVFLRHKTTHRAVYDRARAARPDCDDVLLWNRRGEVTESTLANVVAELDGRRVTPPVACGLLPGTYREALLARGEITEAPVRVADLPRATRLWLINSVRRWIPVQLVE